MQPWDLDSSFGLIAPRIPALGHITVGSLMAGSLIYYSSFTVFPRLGYLLKGPAFTNFLGGKGVIKIVGLIPANTVQAPLSGHRVSAAMDFGGHEGASLFFVQRAANPITSKSDSVFVFAFADEMLSIFINHPPISSSMLRYRGLRRVQLSGGGHPAPYENRRLAAGPTGRHAAGPI